MSFGRGSRYVRHAAMLCPPGEIEREREIYRGIERRRESGEGERASEIATAACHPAPTKGESLIRAAIEFFFCMEWSA